MSHLSPPTLTRADQKALLCATARNPRDHLVYSLALGTGLRTGSRRTSSSLNDSPGTSRR